MPIDPTIYEYGDDLFGLVCHLLVLGHGKGDGSPSVTLNRVFEKCVRLGRNDENAVVPAMTRKNVSIALEERKTAQLAKLASRPGREVVESIYPEGSNKRFKRKVRKTKDIPVIIVLFEGREYLMDGNRRVHYWVEKQAPTMQAYVCRVR